MARLVDACGCEVVAAEPRASEVPHGVRLASLDTLLALSDVVTLHVALTPDTTGLVGRPELALMKPEAIIVNTARGELIDEVALVDALEGERIAGAGLDVLAIEPPADSQLLNHPKVLVTSHIGGSTDEAVYAMGTAAIDGLQRTLSELSVEPSAA